MVSSKNFFTGAKSVFTSAKKYGASKSEEVRISIEIAGDVSLDLIQTLKCAFYPETSRGLVHIAKYEMSTPISVNPSADGVIIVSHYYDDYVISLIEAWKEEGIEPLIIVEESNQADFSSGHVVSLENTFEPLPFISNFLASHVSNPAALVANFPFTRRSVAKRQINKCANANCAIGAIDLISGADFPLMFTSEASMALSLASIYNYPVNFSRLLEIGFVGVWGCALRGVSRLVTKHPNSFSPIFRGAIAWSGSAILGSLLVTRFESGSKVDKFISSASDKVRGLLGELDTKAALLTGGIYQLDSDVSYEDLSTSHYTFESVDDADSSAKYSDSKVEYFSITGSDKE